VRYPDNWRLTTRNDNDVPDPALCFDLAPKADAKVDLRRRIGQGLSLGRFSSPTELKKPGARARVARVPSRWPSKSPAFVRPE
jgi:hypothetical protein